MSPEYSQSIFVLAIKKRTAGVSATSAADFVVFARPILDSLDIDLFPTDMGSSGETLLG